MNTTGLVDDLRRKVCAEVEVEPHGLGRYLIHTPFMFDDGDHFVIVLRHQGQDWVLTDEGHTFMHMSYTGVNFESEGRSNAIDSVLLLHGLQNDHGELRLGVPDDAFGDALFSYVQALAQVTSVTHWTQQRVASAFWEDFRELMTGVVPEDRLAFKYHDPKADPDGIYPVDCRIETRRRPCFVYAIANNSQCREATISIYHYERESVDFTSIAIFEDQMTINRRAVAQLSDVVGRQFASLGAKDRIAKFIRSEILNGDISPNGT